MSNIILWLLLLAALMYGGWYWYDMQPKSYTEIVVQNDENKKEIYPEDACEGKLKEIQQSRINQSCNISKARRVDSDVIEVDILCKGKYSAAGCFICAIDCK